MARVLVVSTYRRRPPAPAARASPARGLIQRSQHASSPRIRQDVDRLNPPHHAVAPVAPLERDEQLADHAAVEFGHPVAARRPGFEKGADALAERVRVKAHVFGFVGQRDVASNQCLEVAGAGGADVRMTILHRC